MAYNQDGSQFNRNNGVDSRLVRISGSKVSRKFVGMNTDASNVDELLDDLRGFNHPTHGTQNYKDGKNYKVQLSHASIGEGVVVKGTDAIPTTGTLIVMIGPADNDNGNA